MSHKIVLFTVFAVIFLAAVLNVNAEEIKLRITAPLDRAEVPERPFVEGTITDPNVKLWVVVHPVGVSDYWVQPNVTIKEDGTWKVKIYIGRPGAVDLDKQFEILAVTDPEIVLTEGKVLDDWPNARCKSQVIEVRRK